MRLIWILSLISLLRSILSTSEWHTALVSNIDDNTFHYYSNVWYNSTPFNTKSSTTKNALFQSYSNIYVEKIRITMDGTTDKSCTTCTFTFSLPEDYSGRFTLMELVTTEGGIETTDDRKITWVFFILLILLIFNIFICL